VGFISPDYYNYYYGNGNENTQATDAQAPVVTVGQDPPSATETTQVPAATEAVPDVDSQPDAGQPDAGQPDTGQPDTNTAAKTEVSFVFKQ